MENKTPPKLSVWIFIAPLLFWGCLIATALFIDRNSWLKALADKSLTAIIILSSGLGCVIGTLYTILVGGTYLGYLQTIGRFKFPSLKPGIIKKWDSNKKRKLAWLWPNKPTKKQNALERYAEIWKFHSENPEETYEELAERFDVSRKTIERALRKGNTEKF